VTSSAAARTNGSSCQLERKPSDVTPGGSQAGLGAGPMVGAAPRLSVSEDTGLLRVGDASKRVRYVPAKTTTVVRRIKPPTDSDDEQACILSTAPYLARSACVPKGLFILRRVWFAVVYLSRY